MKAYTAKKVILAKTVDYYVVGFETADGKKDEKFYDRRFYTKAEVKNNALVLWGLDGLAHRVFIAEEPVKVIN